MTQFLKSVNKQIAKILKRPLPVFILITTLSVLINIFAPKAIIDNFKISYNSLFTGMLALIGFIFAARTFITFKLYETVYSTEKYQDRILQYKKGGAYKQKLMQPLQTLDTALSFTTWMSVIAMFLLTLISFIKPPAVADISTIPNFFTLITQNFKTVTVKSLWTVLFPTGYKFFSDVVCSTFIVVFLQLIYNLRSLNRNISQIIGVWQEKADDYQKNSKGNE